MKSVNSFITERIGQRSEANALRTLSTDKGLIDFCSNDYLGFARSDELKKLYEAGLANYPHYQLGSTGSRLLAGNDRFTETLETDIAGFHGSEASLIFNSGYDANLGLFSSLGQRGDTIITDELIHASIIDGVRLSHANRYTFKHNDLTSLEEKLLQAKKAGGRIYIAVESIYSMDGDEAPLVEICRLAAQFDAALIVDEAHATGIFGKQGRGLTDELGLNDQVFARLITFGKGLGTHGAAVLGSMLLRTFLINFARSFIYTTASSFPVHFATSLAYRFLLQKDHQEEIFKRIRHFRDILKDKASLLPGRSAIQAILIPGNEQVKRIASVLGQKGFDIRPILSPTVKEGSERLRICLHNHNSIEEINNLAITLRELI